MGANRLPLGVKLEVHPRKSEVDSLVVFGVTAEGLGYDQAPLWHMTPDAYRNNLHDGITRINDTIYSQGELGIIFPKTKETISVFPNNVQVPGGLELQLMKKRLRKAIFKGEFMDLFITSRTGTELDTVVCDGAAILRMLRVEGASGVRITKSTINHMDLSPESGASVSIEVKDNSLVGSLIVDGTKSLPPPFLRELSIGAGAVVRALRILDLRIHPEGTQIQVPMEMKRLLLVLRIYDVNGSRSQTLKFDNQEMTVNVGTRYYPTKVVVDFLNMRMREFTAYDIEEAYRWRRLSLLADNDSGPLKISPA